MPLQEFPLVNTGDAKGRETEAVNAIKEALYAICGNELLLHSIVAGGLTHWMVNGSRAFAGLAVGDQTLRDIFHYLRARADIDPKKKLDELLKAAAN